MQKRSVSSLATQKQSHGCIPTAVRLTFNDICIKERLSEDFFFHFLLSLDDRDGRKPADEEEQRT